MKPYIKEIYRLINLISHCHTVVRYHPRKKAIKMKAIFNNTKEKFYRPRTTKQIASLCTKKALVGEQNQRKL